MSTIINILGTDQVTDSRSDINDNFDNLNTDKLEASDIAGKVNGPASATDNALVRYDETTGKIIQDGKVTEDDDGNLQNVDGLDLDLTPTSTTHTPGRLRWNTEEHTADMDTDLDNVSIQLGQELVIAFYNDTGFIIPDGAAVLVRGLFGTIPTVVLAKADTYDNIQGNIFITTMETGVGAEGMMTKFGKVRGINTNSWEVGDALYVSPTNAGELTNEHPQFPDYSIRTAQVVTKSASGIIGVNQTEFTSDTFNDAFDGAFRESIDFMVSSNGSTITGTLTNSDAADNLTMVYSTGLEMLDTTTSPVDIVLTAGTSTVPQANYVYIPISTKVLTVSTTEFPNTEHIKVAFILLRDALDTQDDDALRNTNWNDHLKTTDNNGHILHISERLRQLPAEWDSGVFGSSTVNGLSDVDVANTSGTVYQLHKQVFDAYNTATGDGVHIVNDFTSPYKDVTNLGAETVDALNVTLVNSSFSFVMWGVQNKTGENSHLMINLPTGKYAKNDPDTAVSDANNYSVYSIPNSFNGAGFLIARFTYTLDAAGTTWVLYDTEDLRGKIPNSTAGGGAGGTGITDFTGLNDTPSAYTSQALKLAQVNAGETALEFTDSPTLGGITMTGAIDENQGSNIASATTTDIGAATGNYVNITGTTTITALGTIQAGVQRSLVFSSPLTLTNNAEIVLPTGANITTAAGDTADFASEGSGNWRCVNYQRANGTALDGVTLTGTETLTNKRITERVNTIASSSTPTPAGDTTDEFTVTALAVNATFAAPTGTPTEGQVLLIRIKDNATARTLAWNAIYRASTDLPLPITTIISKTLYLQFVYNNTDSKWDLLGLLNNF